MAFSFQKLARLLPLLVFVLPSALPSVAQAECPMPNLPSQFSLTERWLSWTTKFDLASESGSHGTVTEKLLSLTMSFEYRDDRNQLIAKARETFFSWGSEVVVYDCEDHKIGMIKEQVFKSLFKAYTTYAISDAADQPVGVSQKTEFFSANFSVTDTAGRDVAVITCPFFRLRDKWQLTVVDKAPIDMRLIVMIGAYKTAKDHQRAAESSRSDD